MSQVDAKTEAAPIQATLGPLFSARLVEQHNTTHSLWIIVDGTVFDVTSFQHEHPGGQEGNAETLQCLTNQRIVPKTEQFS